MKIMEPDQKKQKTQNRNKVARAARASLLVMLLGVGFLAIGGYYYRWEFVGVYSDVSGEMKTVWDWMELLLVPSILVLGGYWLNSSTKAHERQIAEQQRENERQIAEQRRDVERELSKDRQQQSALDAYLDKMTDLLLNSDLRASNDGDEVRVIARTITLAVLRGLDGGRRGQVLQFLYEAGLIVGETPIVDLSHADLREISLPYAHLEGITVPRANLRKANLSFAKLQGANFCLADLDDANLSWADLRNTNLQAGLQGADLSVAKLDGASLFRANLGGANLINASLVRADLRYANLKYANPSLGDAADDNLRLANPGLANMSNCDLTGAKIEISQLHGVQSLEGATMPDGRIFEEWSEDARKNWQSN